MKKRTFILRAVLGLIAVLIFMAIFFSVAYVLTAYVYSRTGWNPQEYLRQLVNIELSILLTLLTGSKPPQNGSALARIRFHSGPCNPQCVYILIP